MDISRHQFNKLISCSKEIVSPSRPKFDEKNGSRHMNLKLYSTAEDLHFRMFLRQSTIFLENFSVGLIWTVQESNICITLLRCNGPHGGNKNCAHHHVPHIHRRHIILDHHCHKDCLPDCNLWFCSENNCIKEHR